MCEVCFGYGGYYELVVWVYICVGVVVEVLLWRGLGVGCEWGFGVEEMEVYVFG